ncbi:MAG: hypothetical protein Q4B18_08080 [Bacillota bacterium]|nr:hypothetical protein [Bacillota bacterium]
MKMKTVPIVVVAYNRTGPLQRLLDSLNAAEYNAKNVPLIISIDKGENRAVEELAERFAWRHGEKTIICQKEKLGLRRHIPLCGDFALRYGSVIILEDDLFVSRYFYAYAVQALEFCAKQDRIAGVSLYRHRFNVEASEPFECLDDAYDNWYLQFASSWGEAWTDRQWKAFRAWYDNAPCIDQRTDVPAYVRKWPDSSWLKYFISYLIEKDLYFLYPKKSLTTNFGEAGTHMNTSNTNYQVPLQHGRMEYRFCAPEESQAVYDAFFESNAIKRILAERGFDAAVDLYGQKPAASVKTRYLLTRQPLPRKVVRSYGCCMRPHEDNILYDIDGSDFFLYDMREKGKAPKVDRVRKAQYNLQNVDRRQYIAVLRMFARKTAAGLKRRLRNMTKRGKRT